MSDWKFGAGQTYASPQAAFDACQEAHETGANGTVTFTGAGLNDAAAGGTPDSGVVEKNYRVEIDAAGTPDTFKWSPDGGSTWAATGVAITGSAQALQEGVTVTFGATTGHTLGDRWDWATSYTSAAFTAKQVLLGVGDAVYNGSAAGKPPLRLVHSVTGRGYVGSPPFRLRLDVDAGTTRITLADDQDAAAIIGGKSDGTNLASHFTVGEGIALAACNSAAGRAVVVCEDVAGGETAEDWEFDRCWVDAWQHGLVVGCLRGLSLVNVRFGQQPSGSLIFADGSAGTYGPFSGALTVRNTVGRALGPAIDLSLTDLAFLTVIHSSLVSAEDSALFLLDDGSLAHLALILLNNIIVALADAVACLETDYAGLRVHHAAGTDYYFPGAGSALATVDGTDYATLSAWQAASGADAHSLNADPLFTDLDRGDLTLSAGSPCRMRGRAAADAGLEGNARAISIDIGAYQPSLPANWSMQNEAGQITARIEGRINVAGL